MKNNNKKNIKIINTFISNNIDSNQSYSWQIGYKNFGILLYGFCEWLHKNNEQNKYDNIFFLSRDGFILKKVYSILFPTEKTSYFYVSRRSLALPIASKRKEINEILNYLTLPPIFTIDILLSVFQISVKEVQGELEKCKISLDEVFKRKNFKEDQRIIELVKLIFKKINAISNQQEKLFNEYLEQEKFRGKIAIVDIGWHNSIQKSLIELSKTESMHGYYMGVYDNAKRFEKPNNAFGYIYSYGNNMKQQDKTFSFVSLFETMFLAHEGTTIGYMKEKKKVFAKLAKYEYEQDDKNLAVIDDLQKGAIQFVYDFKNSGISIELDEYVCSYNIIKFGSSPSKKDVNYFENIAFENYKKNNLINFNKNTFYYMFHPKAMINDFYLSGWRVAFLKKLIPFPFPHYFAFKLICTIFKGEK